MWILSTISEDPKRWVLLGNRRYCIGRKDCDIPISGDRSISRRHAQISVALLGTLSAGSTDFTRRPQLFIHDTSKYGTKVIYNDSQKIDVPKDRLYEVTDDCHIGCGYYDTKLLLSHIPMIFVISRLPRDVRTAVRRRAAIIGGHFTQKWVSECTHLVMKKVDFSPKFFFALIRGCFIVSPAFLDSFDQHDPGQELPDPLHFPPEIDPDVEEQLRTTLSLVPNSSRLDLFRGVVFIMLDPEQITKYELMIVMAGGHVVNVSTMTFSEVAQMSFVKDNVGSVVVNPHWNESQDRSLGSLEIVLSMLQRVGFRVFDEDSITLAIIRCDTTIFESRGTSMNDEDQRSVLEQLTEQFEGMRNEALTQGTVVAQSLAQQEMDDVVEILDDDGDDGGHMMKREVIEENGKEERGGHEVIVVEDSEVVAMGDDQVDEIGMEDRKRVRDGMIDDICEEYERRETEYEKMMDEDDPFDHPCGFLNQKKFKKQMVAGESGRRQ